ncbi:MAG: hypothetical protein IT455_00010 [Planctomycetes bacterium]|nr:hypothetical protein [Planctomycetota bacterium]
MLLRRSLRLLPLLLAACGGGGGGSVSPPPVTTASRLTAPPVSIVAGSNGAELVVDLVAATSTAPALLQLEVELPAALTLPANDRLRAVAAVPNLDGDWKQGRFVVLCGDASNQDAAPLPSGTLFRLRLEATLPRQVGSHVVRLRELRAATAGGHSAPVDGTPVEVQVEVL